MKAKWIALAVMAVLATAGAVYASEVGNNPEGKGWRFDFGFERTQTEVELKDPAVVYSWEDSYDSGDGYTWTETYTDTIASFDGRETMDKYFLKLSYGFGDRYSVYARVGMARLGTEMYNTRMSWADDYWEDYYGEEWIWYNHGTYTESPTRGIGGPTRRTGSPA